MSKLDDLINEMKTELGSDFVSTDIVGMDGMSIAGGSNNPDFDSSGTSARFAIVMKLASKTSDKIEMGDVVDNLVTTEQAFILTRFLGNGTYYWGVVVSKYATLGMVRILMDEYADQLWKAIPQ